MLTRILESLCDHLDVDEVKRENCKGMAILPYSSFYPLPYNEIRYMNEPKRKKQIFHKIKNSYGIHLWNSITKKVPFVLNEDNAIDKIMKTHCPSIYNLYVDLE